ncbi:hypothetical protein SD70_15050 [Gordoniibacillus kamchatkensis]|uniref:ABC transporter substrate-binding protein n=1 Tax=Gordoniibacillus kamchatkensis TaxID=1590651 RepID=A0ABR5AGY1_9BACL|nr:extracellular solute-binding protein [Paenibacillus sp. VKM B-2647]KIL40262.1 hypothetical protein SD70_15050 [Paenibacillus sp. VKM B-2647]
MNYKAMSWVLTGSLLMAMLTGCSGGQPQADKGKGAPAASPAEGGNKPQEPVTINFWGAIPEESGPAKVVENWNKANPDIKVNYKRFVNDEAGNTKLETALLANGEVDVFISYRADKVMKRIDSGMAEPLDAYIQKDNFNVEENFGKQSIVKVKNQTYYIPAIILNDFVTLNKKYLDDAKLPIPKDWTWEDYKDYAQKLSKGEGANKIWGSMVGNVPKVYEWMDKAVKMPIGPDAFYTSDGKSNFEHPAFKKYLDDQIDLQNKLKVQPNFAEAKATKMDGNQMFLSGKAAMFWQGTAVLRNIKNLKDYPHDFVTAFAPVPKQNKDDKYVTAGTGYLDFVSINSRSKVKDAAWKFVKWYVTEGNEPMIQGGRVPAWKKADPDKVVSLILGDNPEKLFDVPSFKSALMLDKEFIVDTKFNSSPEIQKIVEEEGERAFIGEQSSEQAVKNMKKRADEVLAKNK